MENKDISLIALEKIKENGIKPLSKNFFNLKRVLFWSLVGFSIFVGSLSFSVILLIILSNDWFLYGKFGLGFIFRTLPYFWFVCLFILTVLGGFYYRKTLLGYRHRVRTIVIIYTTVTVILGSILYIMGLGDTVERSLSENVPIYHNIMFDRNEFWSHPEDGLISGRIVLIDGNKISIVDSRNNIWIVMIDDAFIGSRVSIQNDEFIRILGDLREDNVFNAEQIRPWIGSGPNHGIKMNRP